MAAIIRKRRTVKEAVTVGMAKIRIGEKSKQFAGFSVKQFQELATLQKPIFNIISYLCKLQQKR